MAPQTWNEHDKKLMILLYLLSYSVGSSIQDFWSYLGLDPNLIKKYGITSYRLVENDLDVIHGY